MTKAKQISIGLSIFIAVGAVGVFLTGQSAPPNPAAFDSPEQRRLAEEHAQCAGFYMILRSSLRKENPNYRELDYSYASQFENHMKMGFAFSLNKDDFRSQVQDGAKIFGQQVIVAAEKVKARALVDTKITECTDALYRSSDFIHRRDQFRTADR